MVTLTNNFNVLLSDDDSCESNWQEFPSEAVLLHENEIHRALTLAEEPAQVICVNAALPGLSETKHIRVVLNDIVLLEGEIDLGAYRPRSSANVVTLYVHVTHGSTPKRSSQPYPL